MNGPKKRICTTPHGEYVKRLQARVRKSLCLDLRVDGVPLCVYSTANHNFYALCQEWLFGPHSCLDDLAGALERELVEWDYEKDEPRDDVVGMDADEVRGAIREYVDSHADVVAFSSVAEGGCPGSNGGKLWCLKLGGLYWYIGDDFFEVNQPGEVKGQWPFDGDNDELDATPWYEGYSEVGLDDLAREYEPGSKIRHDGVLMVLTTDRKFMEVEDQ